MAQTVRPSQKRPISLVVSLILLGLMHAIALPASGDVAVHGRVVDADGKPASAVTVNYVRFASDGDAILDRRSAVAGAGGEFALAAPDPATSPVFAQNLWYAERPDQVALITSRTVWLTQPRKAPEIDLHMVRLAPLRVRFLLDGNPVAGIHVSPSAFMKGDNKNAEFAKWSEQISSRWSRVTGSDGVADFDGLPVGYRVGLEIREDRYVRPSARDFVTVGDNAGAVVNLALAGAIDGQVTATDTGKPVPGIECVAQDAVSFRSFYALSDSNGRFRIDKIAAGTYSVSALPWNAPKPYAPSASVQKAVIAGRAISADVTVCPGGEITGKVTDIRAGKPLAGVTVSARSGAAAWRWSAVTDAGGVYSLFVAPGRYVVSPYTDFGALPEKTADAASGTSARADFKIEPPTPHSPITGIVVDNHRRPVPGARVCAVSYTGELRPNAIAATDSAGRFEFAANDLSAEDAIYAIKGRFATLQPVVARRGADVVVQVQPGATVFLAGKIIDERSKPIAGADVSATGMLSNGMNVEERTVSDAAGRYQFALYPNVSYWPGAGKTGYCDAGGQALTAITGGSLVENLTLEVADTAVSGVIVHRDGSPYAGLTLHGDRTSGYAVTDPDGRFQLNSQPRGPFKIWLVGPGRSFNAIGGQTDLRIVADAPAAASPQTFDASRYVRPRYEAMIGCPAPALGDGSWLNGKPGSVASLRGKTVVLAFFQCGCGPCCANLPAVEKLWTARRSQGVEVIGIASYFNAAAVPAYARKHGLTFPILIDQQDRKHDTSGLSFTNYTVGQLPCQAVIDRDGKIASIASDWAASKQSVSSVLRRRSSPR